MVSRIPKLASKSNTAYTAVYESLDDISKGITAFRANIRGCQDRHVTTGTEKLMDKLRKWQEKAKRFKKRATRGVTQRKRTDKIRADEAKAIRRAYGDLKGNVKIIAQTFGRDRRTVKAVVQEFDLDDILADYRRSKDDNEALSKLGLFISEWEAGLPLTLNRLDNADLSNGKTGVPGDFQSGITIMWEASRAGEIVRVFSVEERHEFKILRKRAPHAKVWVSFDACKKLGGAIISACSALIVDIRKQSEDRTGLRMALNESQLEKPILGPYFARTVYVYALRIVTENWEEKAYRFDNTGKELCEIHWGHYRLAVVKWDAKDRVVCAHQDLQVDSKGSEAVKKILCLQQKLSLEEDRLREELKAIKSRLLPPEYPDITCTDNPSDS